MSNADIMNREGPEAGFPKRVLLIALDGATPEVIREATTPHIDRLLKDGACSWRAQSTLPTWSLQCYCSILAGVPADEYELISAPEGWLNPRTYPVPSIFDLVHEAGLKTAMFNNWPPLEELPRPGTVDTMFSVKGESRPVMTAAAECLRRDKPHFCFVHFDDPDETGHVHGWQSAEQCAAVARCDEQIGVLLGAMEETGTREETVVFVMSDHGGGDGEIGSRCHGFSDDPDYSHPANTTVPWICCGPGVRRGHEIEADISICDTAATVAHMLKLPVPPAWQGRVAWEALD